MTSVLVASFVFTSFAQKTQLNYTVDLNDRTDYTFKVTLDIGKLSDDNNIYQFASTAPGTYQTMDIGRFVSNFKAFDKKGKEIAVEKVGINQYKLTDPKKIKKITYTVAETWDTPVDEHVIYKMCGSSIEDDNVLINGQCVFGYPKGMQNAPLEVNLLYPEKWKVGTALTKAKDGDFYAEDYDKIVDSPIMLGDLTKASTTLDGSTIDIYTYSKTDLIKSDDLLNSMKEMLTAAGKFVINFPVDRYVFLFHFEDETWGAWEHSYSSEYIFREQPYTEEFGKGITSTAAHEFFHVITPLNIHSEIIEHFNFVTPTPSEHLWLYEGTTEWASDLMQLRSGMMTLDEYFKQLQEKLAADHHYDSTYSLTKLSLTSYTDEGQAQYGNIYARGALVAGLLDIRLLELSNGKRGLREVIYDLSQKYGPNKAFPEQDFFKIFTEMTYPEIGDFFDKYVKNANPLPLQEYYAKLGIKYTPEIKTGKQVATMGIELGVPDGKIRITALNDSLKAMGLEVNDQLYKVNGTELNFQNAQQILTKLSKQPIGTEYTLTVKRETGDEVEEKTIDCKILSKEEVKRYIFEVDDNASPEQIALRKAWMSNLPQ